MSIELGKESLKISYKRFLADSAPGYVTMLLLAVAAMLPPDRVWLPFRDAGKQLAAQSGELRTFLLVALFFLGPPLGLLLNATSYLFCGRIVELIAESALLGLKGTKEPIFDTVELLYAMETALQAAAPDQLAPLEHVFGAHLMSRSLGFIFLVAATAVCWPLGLLNAAALGALFLVRALSRWDCLTPRVWRFVGLAVIILVALFNVIGAIVRPGDALHFAVAAWVLLLIAGYVRSYLFVELSRIVGVLPDKDSSAALRKMFTKLEALLPNRDGSLAERKP
jgi:hypothetical protein